MTPQDAIDALSAAPALVVDGAGEIVWTNAAGRALARGQALDASARRTFARLGAARVEGLARVRVAAEDGPRSVAFRGRRVLRDGVSVIMFEALEPLGLAEEPEEAPEPAAQPTPETPRGNFVDPRIAFFARGAALFAAAKAAAQAVTEKPAPEPAAPEAIEPVAADEAAPVVSIEEVGSSPAVEAAEPVAAADIAPVVEPVEAIANRDEALEPDAAPVIRRDPPAASEAEAEARAEIKAIADQAADDEGAPQVAGADLRRAAAKNLRFVFEIDAARRVVFLSPDLTEAVGPSASAAIGQRWDEVAQELDLDPSGEVAEKLAQTGVWNDVAVNWPTIDGDRLPILLSALPMFDRGRTFVGFRGLGRVEEFSGEHDEAPPKVEEPAPDAPIALVEALAPSEPPLSEPEPAAAEAQAEEPAPGTPVEAADEGRVEPEANKPVTAGSPAPDEPVALADIAAPAGQPVREEPSNDATELQQAASDVPAWVASIRQAAGLTSTPAIETPAPVAPEDVAAFAGHSVGEERAKDEPEQDESAPAAVSEEPEAEADELWASEESRADQPEPNKPAVAVAETEDTIRSEPFWSLDPRGEMDDGAEQAAPIDAEPVAASDDPEPLAAKDEPEAEPVAEAPVRYEPPSIISAPASYEIYSGNVVPLREQKAPVALVHSEPPRAEDKPDGARAEATTPDIKPSSLTHVEEDAFDEISRLLRVFSADGPGTANAQGAQFDGAERRAPARAAFGWAIDGVASVGPVSTRVDDVLRMVDRMPIGALVLRAGEIAYANKATLDMTGHASFADLVSRGASALFAEPLPKDDAAPSTVRLVAADGVEIEVEAKLNALAWAGSPATFVSLKRADSVAAGARSALQREKEMAEILDTATDGVMTLDGAGRILSVNRSAEALFGFEAADVVGRPFTLSLAPESRRAAFDYLDSLKANGVAAVLNDGREVLGLAGQGGAIPLYLTIGRIGSADEVRYCAVLRDITHWKRAEEELLAAKRQAERASSQKSEFLSRVGHEIRTPLNAIIGFSEVMMEERFGPLGNPRYKDYLKDIHASGGHLLGLVGDLLDLSRVESGAMKLEFASIDLNEVVSQSAAVLQSQANREHVIIRTSLARNLPPVLADRRALRQVMGNLLAAAVKSSRAGGQVIVATAYTDAGDAVIRVRDAGMGMSPKEVARALEPFRALGPDDTNTVGGVNLPLTKALVEANEAAFSITSDLGQGTLAEVTFPAARVLAG